MADEKTIADEDEFPPSLIAYIKKLKEALIEKEHERK